MKYLLIGLVFGFGLGVAAGLLATASPESPTGTQPTGTPAHEETPEVEPDDAEAELEELRAEIEKQIELMEKAHREEMEDMAEAMNASMRELRDKLSEKNSKILELKKQLDDSKESSSSEKPSETEKRIKRIAKALDNLVTIGGPLSPEAVKDLGLDADSAAAVNDILTDEYQRMREQLVNVAAELVEGKTVEEFRKMTDQDIAIALMQVVAGELKMLQKLPPEELIKVQTGEKHFVKVLPKDAKLTRIAKLFYEERKKTYADLSSVMNEEQEKLFKRKYLQSGTFVFPEGGGGYGLGSLTDEDFVDKGDSPKDE